jgi:hypothetical protein
VSEDEKSRTTTPGRGKIIKAANLAQNIPRGGRPIRKSMPTKNETYERELRARASSLQK